MNEKNEKKYAVPEGMLKDVEDALPEVPEAIKDLLLPNIESGFFKPEVVNERMAECYRRGQQSSQQSVHQQSSQKGTIS